MNRFGFITIGEMTHYRWRENVELNDDVYQLELSTSVMERSKMRMEMLIDPPSETSQLSHSIPRMMESNVDHPQRYCGHYACELGENIYCITPRNETE
jgi:hypothetical protein